MSPRTLVFSVALTFLVLVVHTPAATLGYDEVSEEDLAKLNSDDEDEELVVIDLDEQETHVKSACDAVRDKAIQDVPREQQALWMRCRFAEDVPGAGRLVSEDEKGPRGQRRWGVEGDEKLEEARRKLNEQAQKSRDIADNVKTLFANLDKAYRDMEKKRATQDEEREKGNRILEGVFKRTREQIKETTRIHVLKTKIQGEFDEMRANYSRTHNQTAFNKAYYDWRVRWNSSFHEVYPNGNFTVPLEELNNTTWIAETLGDRVVKGFLKLTNETVDYLKSNETFNRYMDAINDLGVQINKTKREHFNHTVPHRIRLMGTIEMRDHIWNKAYPNMRKALDTMHRKNHLRWVEERRQRERQERRKMFFRRLSVRSARVMDEKRHDERARNMMFNKNKALKSFLARPTVKRMMHQGASWRLAVDEFKLKYYATENEVYERQGSAKLEDSLHFAIRTMPISDEWKKRLLPNVELLRGIRNNQTFFNNLNDLYSQFRTKTLRRYEEVSRAMRVPTAHEWASPEARRYFDIESRFASVQTFQAVVDGRAFMFPKVALKSAIIDKDTIKDDIVRFFNETLFGCKTDLIAGVYCFPFVDPDVPPIPNLPDTLNITDRLPVNCTLHLEEVHGKVGALGGFFQKVNDFVGYLFNEIPVLDQTGLFGWSNTDIRRDRGLEIIVCGAADIVLLFLIILVFAIIIREATTLILLINQQYSQARNEREIAVIKRAVLSGHPHLLPDRA